MISIFSIKTVRHTLQKAKSQIGASRPYLPLKGATTNSKRTSKCFIIHEIGCLTAEEVTKS